MLHTPPTSITVASRLIELRKSSKRELIIKDSWEKKVIVLAVRIGLKQYLVVIFCNAFIRIYILVNYYVDLSMPQEY